MKNDKNAMRIRVAPQETWSSFGCKKLCVINKNEKEKSSEKLSSFT